MRVLLTGGQGFLGRVLGLRLRDAGHEVTALVRRPPQRDGLPSVQGDIRDRARLVELIVEGGYDAVCHLAAVTRARESFADPLGYYDTNLVGTLNVLAALQATDEPKRLVFASTAAVYGPGHDGPIPETAVTAPTSPYGAAKLAADEVIGYQAATGALGAASLRTFNVAGAVGTIHDTDQTRLIPKALAVAAGRAAAFPLNGDGSVRREFTHVADLADAYLLALEACEPGRHDVYNVGSGAGVSVRETLDVVEQVTGRHVAIDQRPAQNEPAQLLADSTRIRDRLGWRPTRSDLPTIVTDAWAALARPADTTAAS